MSSYATGSRKAYARRYDWPCNDTSKTNESVSTMQPLQIFIIHPSDLLTDYLPNGDGLIAHGFIKNLADRGHRIYIAARAVDLRKPLPENVKIFTLKRRINFPVLDRAEYMVRARLLFESLCKTVRFDLLHQMNPVFVGLSLAFVGCKAPVVLGTIVPRWANDSDSLAAQYPAFRRLIEWGRNRIMALQQRHASALLLTSKAAMNKVPEPERVKAEIHSIPHGIDSQVFSPDNPKICKGVAASILFLASLQEKKGIYVLLAAYAELLNDFPDLRLTIAGGGPEAEKVAQRARDLGSRANVSLLGRVDRATALRLIQHSTVFCLPSFGEPYATTVIEAMSCGKAVIATDAGGIPELLPPGGGVLVPPRDPSALAAALKRVLENEALRTQMGSINRRYVEEHLTWSAVVNRLESIYASVVKN